MADKKISALTLKSTIHINDIIPIVDSEAAPITTKRVLFSTIKALFEPPITAGSAGEYFAYDKTFKTLNQAAVAGLKTSDTPTFNALVSATDIKTPVIKPASDGTTAIKITKADGSTGVITIDTTNAKVAIGNVAPTAALHIKAGSATAATAPIKLTSGALNTNPEAGAIEFLTDDFYVTETTGTKRKRLTGVVAYVSGSATAAKTTTVLFTPAKSGLYRINIDLQVTRAATTSSVLGGATGVVVTFRSNNNGSSQTIVPLLIDQAGAVIVPATGNTGNASTTNSNGSGRLHATTPPGADITFAIGYTSVGATTMQYAYTIWLEAV